MRLRLFVLCKFLPSGQLFLAHPLARSRRTACSFSAAQEMLPALPLEIVRKKINVSDAVAWEHEQFSRKDILAVTLSGHATHDPALRASVLDRTVDSEVLSRNILFVANSIAKVAVFLPATTPPLAPVGAAHSAVNAAAQALMHETQIFP